MNIMKKGFTLVEIIVVITIIAIIAAIAVPSIVQYYKYSEDRYRNNVARTLFVAATNSLTQKSIAGLLNDLPYDGYVNLENLITDDENFYDDEINYNTGNIVYVTSKENVSRILDGYIMDTSVLNNAILIEYNIATGKVLSVFYSDKVHAFGYGHGNFTDVANRTKEAREEKKIGFYGARTTGIPERE
ncbi:MAG: prepilin-type N-terminal cleavage/methylation domain-containing protein [Clostridiaceae bacterium]|nr:prepilin-type N-terminal cleavage/methylation domain-containing protein [Clostridiaceae bacterium]